MERTTLIFGNGLGMALDHDYFSLSTAMARVWDECDDYDEPLLSDEDKRRVVRCIGRENIDSCPVEERELDILQQVVNACNFLNSVGDDKIHWLSRDARLFPASVKAFLGRVAQHFHDYEGELPERFIDDLCQYVVENKCHVATLNYDDLLYQPFIQKVFDGYNTLVDGFIYGKFAEKNLRRKGDNKFAWYLHLHGSPLFFGRSREDIEKLPHYDLVPEVDHDEAFQQEGYFRHVVLTHSRYKRDVIFQSHLLQTYWDYFSNALAETTDLVIFGYSGEDSHLNEIIRHFQEQFEFAIEVVEWNGNDKDYDKRMDFWRKSVCGRPDFPLKLVHLDNILDYQWSHRKAGTRMERSVS